ncbi:Protein of unknown function [Gryllus bimaculatus]|nr:Protein of unknown function [Gryllus bimaculatus]
MPTNKKCYVLRKI